MITASICRLPGAPRGSDCRCAHSRAVFTSTAPHDGSAGLLMLADGSGAGERSGRSPEEDDLAGGAVANAPAGSRGARVDSRGAWVDSLGAWVSSRGVSAALSFDPVVVGGLPAALGRGQAAAGRVVAGPGRVSVGFGEGSKAPRLGLSGRLGAAISLRARPGVPWFSGRGSGTALGLRACSTALSLAEVAPGPSGGFRRTGSKAPRLRTPGSATARGSRTGWPGPRKPRAGIACGPAALLGTRLGNGPGLASCPWPGPATAPWPAVGDKPAAVPPAGPGAGSKAFHELGADPREWSGLPGPELPRPALPEPGRRRAARSLSPSAVGRDGRSRLSSVIPTPTNRASGQTRPDVYSGAQDGR